MLSTSEEEGTEPAQPGPSSPQRQPKVKKESKKSKKPTKKKKVSCFSFKLLPNDRNMPTQHVATLFRLSEKSTVLFIQYPPDERLRRSLRDEKTTAASRPNIIYPAEIHEVDLQQV